MSETTRPDDALILDLVRGLQATVAKQAETIAVLRAELEALKASRQPTMAVGRTYQGVARRGR